MSPVRNSEPLKYYEIYAAKQAVRGIKEWPLTLFSFKTLAHTPYP